MSYVSFYASLTVGSRHDLKGNVTKLRAYFPGSQAQTERNVGYHLGRLGKGYVVAVLTQTLSPDDFQLEGITRFSGGRYGKPAMTDAADRARPSVHETALKERGAQSYTRLQQVGLDTVQATGRDRIVKLLPAIEHKAHMPPAEQYPMGEHFLQWRLTRPREFLVALRVDPNGQAQGQSLDVNLATGGYDAWARVARYLGEVA